MTILELKTLIKDLPDDMPVLVREYDVSPYENPVYDFTEAYASLDPNKGLIII